jgi:very-short-patch-repair endonuclease
MDVHALRALAAGQEDLVATWQLRRAGWTARMVDDRARRGGWPRVHRGVYALTQAPLTRSQRRRAATLTTATSALSHASCGDLHGFRPFDGPFESITRPGAGGPRQHGSVLVFRAHLDPLDVVMVDGMRATTAERALIDLAPRLSRRAMERALREALRLRAATPQRLLETLARHRGRRGAARLLELARRYRGLPYARTRSNAEARALEVLADAGLELPEVNVRIAGEEADLVWRDRRLIIEIDGPQFHRFPDVDRNKQLAWRGAGFTVRRLGSQAVYDRPAELLALSSG